MDGDIRTTMSPPGNALRRYISNEYTAEKVIP